MLAFQKYQNQLLQMQSYGDLNLKFVTANGLSLKCISSYIFRPSGFKFGTWVLNGTDMECSHRFFYTLFFQEILYVECLFRVP